MSAPLPLILGEAPSKAGDRFHAFPLSGAVGKRLCQWAGLFPETHGSTYGRYYWPLRECFDCVNAIERFADAYPWRVAVARERVRRYLEEHPTDVVVALGRKAAAAVGLAEVPWGTWYVVNGRARVAVLPHPSARNRTLNDPAIEALCSRVLREALGR